MAKETSMFGKFKNLFVEEVESENKPPKESVKTPTPIPSSTPTRRPRSQTESTVQGQSSDKFMKILFGAMDKANKEGFDYLEFKNSLNSLKKMQQMDEMTRFQSAFAMAQTMGATPQKLVQTAQHYLSVLQVEETKFEQALESNRQRQIGVKEAEMKELAQSIKLKEEEIKRMTAEIENSKKKHNKISLDIKSASTKIAQTKADFIFSYNALAAQINRDIEKIKTYLK